MKWFFTYATILIFCLSGTSQPNVSKFIEKGKKALEEFNFSGAMEYLSEALAREGDNLELMYLYAEASRQQYAFAEAERSYQIVVDSMDNNQYPEASFYLAEMKMMKGDYEAAKTFYDLYLSENEGDDELKTKRAHLLKESADWAIEQLNAPQDSVKLSHLGAFVNTPYSEHAAIEHEDKLYFTSLRFPKEKDKYEVNRTISKVLVQQDTMESQLLDESGIFNSGDLFTSSSVFSEDGHLMFYSICDYTEEGRIKCDIYYRLKDDSGIWGNDIKLGSEVNDTAATSTQPALLEHGDSTYTLYFSSNRRGGKGGMDIWKSDFDSLYHFSPSVNVADVNTEWDDITPFFHKMGNKLYFSSDGRIGMGGFDAYSAWISEQGDWVVENLGPQINSSYHEIFYVRNEERAHFSSNRLGSMYLIDKFETCCYDVYSAEFNMCEIKFLTFDALSQEKLNGVKIVIRFENGDWHTIDSLEQLSSNEFKFLVDCDVQFTLEATRPGYLPLQFSESDIEPFYLKELYLERAPIELSVHTFEEITKLPLDGVRVQLLDGENNFDLLEEQYDETKHGYSFEVIPGLRYRIAGTKDGYGPDELDLLIPRDQLEDMDAELYLRKIDLGLHILTLERAIDEPLKGVKLTLEDLTDPSRPPIIVTKLDTHLFVFDIKNEHRYRATAEKDGYVPEIIGFEAIYTGEDTITKRMYLGRIPVIETLANLLPMNLYFDNDEPDPNTRDTTTRSNYSSTFFFYNQKIDEFKDRYSAARPSARQAESRAEIDRFFGGDLKGGHDSLSIFLETLERILDAGKKVNLYFRGFASPLHDSDYNINLGKRRIMAFRNEFLFYRDGVFRDYIDAGLLTLTERSFGETTAPPEVSDDPGNRGLSVYSPGASRERRIEIEEIIEIKN